MNLRRSTVEHPFGTIKAWMGTTHLQMRRLRNVPTEMALNVLAYNIEPAPLNCSEPLFRKTDRATGPFLETAVAFHRKAKRSTSGMKMTHSEILIAIEGLHRTVHAF